MLGLRPFTVTVLQRQWSGTRVGMGTKTDTLYPLQFVNGKNPPVKRLSQKDIGPSNRLYIEGDYQIGPFTPPYIFSTATPAGIQAIWLDPAILAGQGLEIYYQVQGPDDPPTGGQYCERIYYDAAHPLSRMLVVRPLNIVI